MKNKNNQTAYMNSNFPRNAGDHYPTIDTRCLDGLLYFIKPGRQETIVDVCADQGSGIVDDLRARGYNAQGAPDAFCSNDDLKTLAGGRVQWIITNTPYELSMVNKIMWAQIKRIEECQVFCAAFLLRSTFDHAAKRKQLFDHPSYAGQIKLCFRPWWTESRDKSPFHVYTWQIFNSQSRSLGPAVSRYYAPYEKRYAADIHNFKCRWCGNKSRIKYTSQDRVGVCGECNDEAYSVEAK